MFFDDWFLQDRDHFKRLYGKPKWIEYAVLEDDATEGAWNYPTIWFDEERNKWLALYGGAMEHSFSDHTGFHLRTQVLLMAESVDGIRFTKSKIEPFPGQLRENQVFPRENNCLPLRYDGSPVYYDTHAPKEGRLKYLYRFFDKEGKGTQYMAQSPDGLQWTSMRITDAEDVLYHSPASLFYNQKRNCLTLSNWYSPHDHRIVFRDYDGESSFYSPRLVMQADGQDSPLNETYAMIIAPYDGYYIGLLWMYQSDDNEIQELKLHGNMEGYLVYAYDPDVFLRADYTPFITRNSLGQHGGGCIFPSCLIQGKDDIRIYSSGSYGAMFREQGRKDAAIMVHTLRKDGFVSFIAKGRGHLTTKSLKIVGDRLYVNVSVPYGNLKAQLVNEEGPIEGYTFNECVTLDHVDGTQLELSWKEKKGIGMLKNQLVYLELELINGCLYSIYGDFHVVHMGKVIW